MPIPANKIELTFAVEHSYNQLKKELENIPINSVSKKKLDGHIKGIKISITDLVSYLIGWGNLVLKWNKKLALSEEDYLPEKGYKWNELGKLAQKFYLDYEHLSYIELLNTLDTVAFDILDLINKTENTDLYEKIWYKKYTKGRMIQLNTSSPYKNAKSRIRKWKKQKSN